MGQGVKDRILLNVVTIVSLNCIHCAAGLLVITGVFLLTAYCLRTRALERRVKAMDTQAVDTKVETNGGVGGDKQNHLGVPGRVILDKEYISNIK